MNIILIDAKSEDMLCFNKENVIACIRSEETEKLLTVLGACDFIVVLSDDEEKKKEMLAAAGITSEKLLTRKEWEAYRKRILLLSHELTNTGAPAVLFYFAKILKENGFEPMIASLVDGNLRKEVEEAGIPVMIEEKMNSENEKFWMWMKGYHTIIFNTLMFSNQIEELRGCNNHIIWWLHEGDDVYEYLSKTRKYIKVDDAFQVVSAGAVATHSYQKYYGGDISTLYYGIPDNIHKEKKLIFALIGAIQPRKAQDLFVKAVKCLPQSVIDNSEFWIVGRDLYEDFAKEVKEQSKEIPQIIFKGEIPLSRMQEIYEQIDVLVCPSKIDTMPVVVTEAFKNAIPCIVAEKIGQAELLENGKEGITFRQEDCQDMAEKMVWMYEHKDQLVDMGNHARKLYEQYFSMEAFEKNILRLV